MDRDVNQLKKKARRAEQQADWDRAIKLYREAIRVSEASDEYAPDVSIYNRVGDLYRRGGDTDRAVHYYLEAVDRYAEQDLQTGAIALCNKILRITPDRVEVYRKLGRLHAATGLVAEARNSYLEYASRMEEEGHPEARQEAFLELARITEDEDLYLQTVEELEREGRVDEAVAALEKLWEARRERGEASGQIRRRIVALDPAADPVPTESPAGALGPESPATDGEAAGVPDEAEPTAPTRDEGTLPDEQPVASDAGVTADEPDEVGGESAGRRGATDQEEGPEEAGAPASDRTEVRLRYAEVLCRSGRESEAVEQLEKLLSEIDPVEAPERALRGLELLDDVGGLDAAWRDRASDWSEHAPDPVTAEAPRRLAAKPDPGDSGPADAAVESGPEPEAQADVEVEPEASPGEVVREGDAEDAGRRERPSGEEVDRVEDGAQLDELLVDFRARVEETVGQADPEEHLEMGQALHDMGRLDEAIREFQVAARAPEPPIRAFELLGAAFLEKGLVSVAVRVLTRALRTPGHKDHDLLQVLYLLGLAREELGETEAALDCYERVYSVDIDFRDVADRMRTVTR
jgi:tetratricopeptide (TPR) repeat protein